MRDTYILFKPLRGLWGRILPPLKYATTRWVLIPKLKSDSAEIRSYAAQALESMGDVQAVLPLIEALRDVDSTVRRFAISSLGALRDVRAVDPLIPFLNDAEPDMRCAAAVALGDLKAIHSVEPLIAALNDPDRSVCSATIIALGKIGSRRAIDPLNELARTTDSEWLRRYVSETLHQIEEHEDKNDSYREALY
jgi:HEAT repeat protein